MPSIGGNPQVFENIELSLVRGMTGFNPFRFSNAVTYFFVISPTSRHEAE
jgi:hypothetical protein